MVFDQQHTLAVRAAEILGSPAEAEDWLRRPAPALNGKRPIDLLGTADGRLLLDNHLTGLEWGEGLPSEHIGLSGGETLSSLFG